MKKAHLKFGALLYKAIVIYSIIKSLISALLIDRKPYEILSAVHALNVVCLKSQSTNVQFVNTQFSNTVFLNIADLKSIFSNITFSIMHARHELVKGMFLKLISLRLQSMKSDWSSSALSNAVAIISQFLKSARNISHSAKSAWLKLQRINSVYGSLFLLKSAEVKSQSSKRAYLKL